MTSAQKQLQSKFNHLRDAFLLESMGCSPVHMQGMEKVRLKCMWSQIHDWILHCLVVDLNELLFNNRIKKVNVDNNAKALNNNGENNQNTWSDLFAHALDGHKVAKHTEVLDSARIRLSKHSCSLPEFSFCIVQTLVGTSNVPMVDKFGDCFYVFRTKW